MTVFPKFCLTHTHTQRINKNREEDISRKCFQGHCKKRSPLEQLSESTIWSVEECSEIQGWFICRQLRRVNMITSA